MLGNLLRDGSAQVRAAAAEALGALGDHAREQAALLPHLLRDRDPEVSAAATEAIGALGVHVPELAPLLANLLTDEDRWVRVMAAGTLGTLGKNSAAQAPSLANLLTDDDRWVREATAEALGALGEHAREQAPLLANLLSDREDGVRVAAVEALGALAEHAREQALSLAGLLNDELTWVYEAAREALVELGPLPIEQMPSILTHLHTNASRAGEIRFLAYFLGGGNLETGTLLAWLGVPAVRLVEDFGNRRDASDVLIMFKNIWAFSEDYKVLQQDIASRVGIIFTGNWGVKNEDLLIWFENQFRENGFTNEAEALQQEISRIHFTVTTHRITAMLATHAVFWLVLIFLYPRYRQIQAIFFWNRWIRRLAGLGYIGFLLTWVPFLRQRLFAPFRQSLLADAHIIGFNKENYFEKSTIQMESGEIRILTEVISRVRGQMVLEGESGLGKSMFLRHLLKDYPKLIVFLLATDCNDGVMQAIRNKLEGPARDPVYLSKLIYAGAFDVVIDGVNEASPDTRARIGEFANRFSKGNLLLVMQPMEWKRPPIAKVYVMQQLDEPQIEDFLISRFPVLSSRTNMIEETFIGHCRKYVREALGEVPFEDKREAMRRVLSNPMDLTVVAEMLANGRTPDMFELQRQHFELMADDYNYHQPGDLSFPLRRFSEHVYHMATNDVLSFAGDEFVNELSALARHKMVVRYHQGADPGMQLWTFRHDKIRDFFLVQTFLGGGNDRPSKHLSDPRFHGTYMQLAYFMPLEAAEELERQLIDYAADTKDHSVSDRFIQLLRFRKSV